MSATTALIPAPFAATAKQLEAARHWHDPACRQLAIGGACIASAEVAIDTLSFGAPTFTIGSSSQGLDFLLEVPNLAISRDENAVLRGRHRLTSAKLL